MENESFDIFNHPDFSERSRVFKETYDLIDMTLPGDLRFSKRSLRRRSDRICRFCSRSYSTTSFSNYSHLFPQLIGNKDLYSDFECDDCNKKFSVFENDLAEFLGISRSLTGINGSGNAPSFRARKLSTKSRSFVGDNLLIIAPEDIKQTGNRSVVTYTKNAFTPANVYKALLKSSLSLLSDSEIANNYSKTIEYLSGRTTMQSGARIDGYILSFSLSLPLHTYLFRKKRADDPIPTHLISFNFQNHIINFPIPFHQQDIRFYPNDYSVIHPPPYFLNEVAMMKSMPVSYSRDLYSNEKITDEEESITIEANAESLKNSVKYDPKTNEIKKTEGIPEKIKHLIITKGNVKIDPKALFDFLKEQMPD